MIQWILYSKESALSKGTLFLYPYVQKIYFIFS